MLIYDNQLFCETPTDGDTIYINLLIDGVQTSYLIYDFANWFPDHRATVCNFLLVFIV